MDEPVSLDRARSRGGWRIALAGVLVVVVVAVIVVGVVAFRDVTRAVPSFPSLKAQPDPSLHGTVAYFSDRDSCVWIISASGARSKKVLCVPPIDVAAATKLGKPMGPQLVWRTDGRTARGHDVPGDGAEAHDL